MYVLLSIFLVKQLNGYECWLRTTTSNFETWEFSQFKLRVTKITFVVVSSLLKIMTKTDLLLKKIFL